jgi:hypothetical protein
MQPTTRFTTLSLAKTGARQLQMKGKAGVAVSPHEWVVSAQTLAHARAVGDANRWARKLLFRGVRNNPFLLRCDQQVADKAINLLSAELAAIARRSQDPWTTLVARCEAIARHGIGNCHECSELTFLYLAATLATRRIDQVLYADQDHVVTLTGSGEDLVRSDPWTTIAVPVLQDHGNKKLDFDLLAVQVGALGFGSGLPVGEVLRSCTHLTDEQRRVLQRAVTRLDRLKPADCMSDDAIRDAPEPPTTNRTGAVMDDGTLWPLSRRRPVTALVCGDQRLDVDTYSVNDYFHALFNPLPRRNGMPFPTGCFDFAEAIERLLGNQPQALLDLIDRHGFDADAVAPLLVELFDLAIHDEPTRDDALKRLTDHGIALLNASDEARSELGSRLLSGLRRELLRTPGAGAALLPVFNRSLHDASPGNEALDRLLATWQARTDRDDRACDPTVNV